MFLPEHTQNLPMLGLNQPGAVPATRAAQRSLGGYPWNTNLPGGFVGLAYCVGGRSLYWGGWSPQLLICRYAAARWPAAVVAELNNALPNGSRSYFLEQRRTRRHRDE